MSGRPTILKSAQHCALVVGNILDYWEDGCYYMGTSQWSYFRWGRLRAHSIYVWFCPLFRKVDCSISSSAADSPASSMDGITHLHSNKQVSFCIPCYPSIQRLIFLTRNSSTPLVWFNSCHLQTLCWSDWPICWKNFPTLSTHFFPPQILSST